MSNLRKIGNKLFTEKEIKLQNQQIELARQLKDFAPAAQSIYLDARNLAQKDLMDLRDKFEDGEKKLIKLSNELNSQIEKVSKTAKSIGVNIKETSVYKSMTEAVMAVEDYEKSFNKAINKVKSIGI